MADTYDVVVVGGGAPGENAAWYGRDNGFSVAVVERELLGGECTFWACMPSKALLRPGEVLAAARRVPGAAPAVTGEVDAAAALRSRDAFTSDMDDKYQVQWLDSVGADLVRGAGRLAGERTVEVTAADGSVRTLQARRAVIVATGTDAAVPPVDGLRDIAWWDNRDATTMQRVPRRLLVLGGGAVGVEIAQASKRLGAEEVTVVELFDHLLAFEEQFAGERLREALEAEGIAVLTDANTVRASRAGDGPVSLELEEGRRLEADELLVATGRSPRTDDIGLDSVGLPPGEYIKTDDQMRVVGVTGDWLYAVGDVTGRALLTHQGKYQARIAADVIAGKDRSAWADHRAIPRVVFTDPQVAAVGKTEREAREAGIAVRTLSVELGSTAAAALQGKGVSGAAQLVVDEPRRTVVGATFVGPGVAEMLHAATIAIVSGITIDELWHAVPSFPTLSEVWLRLLEADRGVS